MSQALCRAPGCCVVAWLAVSRHSPSLASRYTPASSHFLATIHYVYCNTKKLSNLPLLVTIHCNVLLHTPQPSSHLSCNTILLLQYTSPAYPMLQYTLNPLHSLNRLCHNTIPHCIVTQLGSSPTNFCTIFFSFLHFSFFFSHNLLLENTQKYIYTFFFHFPEYSNKFIKIYFIHFL